MSGPADVWHEQVAQDEAKKEQKNKNFTTEKKKETIQAIKLHNQPTTMLDFGPHVTPGTPGCVKNVAGVRSKECVYACVCLEWYCVQLQRDRTSVGCSQARSDRLNRNSKGDGSYAEC